MASTGKEVFGIKMPYAIIFMVIAVFLWEALVRFWQLPGWLLPAPSEVAFALVEMAPLLAGHAQYTLLAAGVGLVAAVMLAFLIAIFMDFSPVLRRGIYPLLVISQTVPIISIAPLFIIWFGYGLLPKIIVVTLVCFFPMVVSVVEGMRAADPDMVKLLKVMGAGRWQVMKKVRVPAALPSFFAGFKIAGTYSIMGAVIGEWLGASKGLGVFMTRAMHSYQLDRVFAAIVVITALSLILFAFIELTARVIMPWHYKNREG